MNGILNIGLDIEKAIGVQPLETLSIHPMRPLYEACRQMLKTRARRIPLVDIDDETGREMVVSVITQYRILKFIAVNVDDTELLKKTVLELKLGSYGDLQTASMETSVIDVIHMMVKYNISSIPIVDEEKHLLNVFEAVDVIACIKGGAYDELTTSVSEALGKRSDDFAGIYTCTQQDRLDSIFHTIRMSRVHRLVVIDDENRLKGKSFLLPKHVSQSTYPMVAPGNRMHHQQLRRFVTDSMSVLSAWLRIRCCETFKLLRLKLQDFALSLF